MTRRLVVPAANSHTCVDELLRIQAWAGDNNLRLNTAKSREIIFRARGVPPLLPPPSLDIKQVTQLTTLGVIINDQLTMSDRVTELLTSCSKLLYALRVLRARGLPQQSLQDIFRSALDIDTLFTACDEQFFSKITNNSSHILQQFIPDKITVNYNLRARPHNKTLISKTTDLNERIFLIRNLYKDCY